MDLEEKQKNFKTSFMASNRKSIANFFNKIDILTYENNKGSDINERLLKFKELKTLSELTHISPLALVIILFILLLLVLFGFYEEHFTIILGTIYPLYFSIKTLKHHGKLKEVKRWLTYWIFFSVFIWFENVCYWLLYYIPFYFAIRSFILILCYLPEFDLSSIFYDKLIKVIFSKYHNKLRNMAGLMKNKLYGLSNEVNVDEKQITNAMYKSLSYAKLGRSSSPFLDNAPDINEKLNNLNNTKKASASRGCLDDSKKIGSPFDVNNLDIAISDAEYVSDFDDGSWDKEDKMVVDSEEEDNNLINEIVSGHLKEKQKNEKETLDKTKVTPTPNAKKASVVVPKIKNIKDYKNKTDIASKIRRVTNSCCCVVGPVDLGGVPFPNFILRDLNSF